MVLDVRQIQTERPAPPDTRIRDEPDVRLLGAVDVDDRGLLAGLGRSVAAHGGVAHGHRLVSFDELVEYVHAPLDSLLDDHLGFRMLVRHETIEDADAVRQTTPSDADDRGIQTEANGTWRNQA